MIAEASKMGGKASRRTLLIMVAVFGVPYLLAWFLYFRPGVLDLGTRNHGTLITPMISSEQFQLVQFNGEVPLDTGDSDLWTLLSFGQGECDTDCEKTLFTLQQLRKMVGVEKMRIRRGYVVPADSDYQAISSGLAQFQGTEILVAEPGQMSWLEEKLQIESGQLPEHIVIADPSANLVMFYPRDMAPKKIFADIEILFGRVKRI